MKKNRLWALLMATGLVVTTIVGCGGSDSGTTAGTTASTTGETTAGASSGQTEPEATTEASTKAEPAEIPKLVIYNNSGVMTNTADNQLGSDPEAYADMQNYILENLGILVEVIVPPSDSNEADQKLSTLLAGGDQVDMWWDDWTDYYQDGMIMPINDYLGTPETQNLWDAWDSVGGWVNTTDSDGNIWGVPRMAHMSAYPIFVRNEWLDLVGMDMPTTFDELNTYLYAVKELDPYGNGETVPLVLESGTNPVNVTELALLAGFVENGQGRWLDETDGKIKPHYLAEGYMDFIKQLNLWYQDGIIHKEWMSHKSSDVQQMVLNGRAGATAVWYSRVTLQEPSTRENLNLDISKYDYTYGWSDTGVTGPNGNYLQTRYLGNKRALMISSKCEHPEAAMKFIAWAFEPENKQILSKGLYEKYWEWDPNIENAEELGATKTIEGAPGYAREFDVALGAGIDLRDPVVTFYADGVRVMQNLWGTDIGYDLSLSTYNSIEAEVMFDTEALSDVAPMGDVNTYRYEETAKFIRGERSFETWDAFIQDMYDLGLDAYIEECTRQYNELMGQ